ncbi:MAG: DedA family protein [Chloroflexi bacterium]|nr:VTT domain-containing protein [Chloroflexota bacterium]MQC26826.1 DedA family protein [Chloroflexota bacterium]
MGSGRRLRIIRWTALFAVVAISIAIVLLPEEQATQLERFGYPGIFLLSILSNATVLLPAPGLLVVFSMGARFAPLGIALAAGSGAAIGELSGYLAGFSGQAVIENVGMYKKMVTWMGRNGPLTVLLLAFLPNPFFDLTGIAAGALKMPIRQFLLWCWLGKIGKMLLVSLAGAGIIALPWITNLLAR